MEFNIYEDLDFDFGKQLEELQKQKNELSNYISKLEEKIKSLNEEVAEIKLLNEVLQRNISELYKTAKAENTRKDRLISELRIELDTMFFKCGKIATAENNAEYNTLLKEYKRINEEIQRKNSVIASLKYKLEVEVKRNEELKQTSAVKRHATNEENEERVGKRMKLLKEYEDYKHTYRIHYPQEYLEERNNRFEYKKYESQGSSSRYRSSTRYPEYRRDDGYYQDKKNYEYYGRKYRDSNHEKSRSHSSDRRSRNKEVGNIEPKVIIIADDNERENKEIPNDKKFKVLHRIEVGGSLEDGELTGYSPLKRRNHTKENYSKVDRKCNVLSHEPNESFGKDSRVVEKLSPYLKKSSQDCENEYSTSKNSYEKLIVKNCEPEAKVLKTEPGKEDINILKKPLQKKVDSSISSEICSVEKEHVQSKSTQEKPEKSAAVKKFKRQTAKVSSTTTTTTTDAGISVEREEACKKDTHSALNTQETKEENMTGKQSIEESIQVLKAVKPKKQSKNHTGNKEKTDSKAPVKISKQVPKSDDPSQHEKKDAQTTEQGENSATQKQGKQKVKHNTTLQTKTDKSNKKKDTLATTDEKSGKENAEIRNPSKKKLDGNSRVVEKVKTKCESCVPEILSEEKKNENETRKHHVKEIKSKLKTQEAFCMPQLLPEEKKNENETRKYQLKEIQLENENCSRKERYDKLNNKMTGHTESNVANLEPSAQEMVKPADNPCDEDSLNPFHKVTNAVDFPKPGNKSNVNGSNDIAFVSDINFTSRNSADSTATNASVNMLVTSMAVVNESVPKKGNMRRRRCVISIK